MAKLLRTNDAFGPKFISRGKNKEMEFIRASRTYKIEQHWLFVAEGKFEIKPVKIDDWLHPNLYLPIQRFVLSTKIPQVLHVPIGYGSSLKALEPNSKLFIFADYKIEHAKLDDYLYPADYFAS